MRVAIITGIPVGGAGAALPTIAAAPGVDIACVILAGPAAVERGKALRKKLLKTWRIGLLGALNGLRLRTWYHHSLAWDVRDTAREHGIPVVEVTEVNSGATIEALRAYRVDLGISLGNGYIRSAIYQTPPLGMINYHGELLPEYPGALSIVWPIYFGRTTTGFTVHQIDRGIDTGRILLRREFEIEFRPTLRETVATTGANIHPHMPAAVADVLANWDLRCAEAKPNHVTRSFTTPTFGEFMTMTRNNRRLFRERQMGLLCEGSPKAGQN